MRPTLRFPDEAREAIARKYRNQHREWLQGAGRWPLEIALGCPTEAEAQLDGDSIRDWVSAWRAWQGPGELFWCERRWRTLGSQALPERLVLKDAASAAASTGEEQRWNRARCRYREFVDRWPRLAPVLPRYFDALADYTPRDIQTLAALLGWIEANPQSNLYLRQIPLAGMDTKWLELRTPLVGDLVSTLQGEDRGDDRAFIDGVACGRRLVW